MQQEKGHVDTTIQQIQSSRGRSIQLQFITPYGWPHLSSNCAATSVKVQLDPKEGGQASIMLLVLLLLYQNSITKRSLCNTLLRLHCSCPDVRETIPRQLQWTFLCRSLIGHWHDDCIGSDVMAPYVVSLLLNLSILSASPSVFFHLLSFLRFNATIWEEKMSVINEINQS